MPYLAEPSPQAVQTTALLLYAVAFRARSDAGLRIPRQNLWNLADSYPGVAEAVGGRLGFYAAIRALAGTYSHLVQVVTSTGRRTDVVLFRDLTIGARGYGIYGLGHDEAEEEASLRRRGLTPNAPLPDELGVTADLPRRRQDLPKRCCRCRVVRPAAEFGKRGSNGLQSMCKGCKKADAAQRNGRRTDGRRYEETRYDRDRRVLRDGMTFGDSA